MYLNIFISSAFSPQGTILVSDVRTALYHNYSISTTGVLILGTPMEEKGVGNYLGFAAGDAIDHRY